MTIVINHSGHHHDLGLFGIGPDASPKPRKAIGGGTEPGWIVPAADAPEVEQEQA